MAIVFGTGFDEYAAGDMLEGVWNSEIVGSVSRSVTTGGRNNTNCLQISGDGNYELYKTLPGTYSTLCFNLAYKFNALPTGTRIMHFAALLDSSSLQIYLTLLPDGRLRVHRAGGTALATSSDTFYPNIWYHFSWLSTIHGSTGTTKVKVNGVTAIDATGLNTSGTGNPFANRILLWHSLEFGETSKTFYFDDVVVDNAVQLPELECKIYLPSGTGTTNQWGQVGAASLHEATDDTTPNDNTDYGVGGTVSQYSLLTYPTISNSAQIYAIVPEPHAEKTDSGVATFTSIYHPSGGALYEGATKAPNDGSYLYFPDIWLINPATGVTWTASDFNTGEFGFKRLS